MAGVWSYGPMVSWAPGPRCQTQARYVTVVYLDGDPRATAGALQPLVEARWGSGAVRPLFAGPLRSVVEWEAWP